MKKILFGLLPLLLIFAGCEGLEDKSISNEEFESVFEYEFNENVNLASRHSCSNIFNFNPV